MKKILEIGCGDKKVKGAIGLDFVKGKEVDVIHDLNKTPYPFKNNTFDEIYVDNVLEHLDKPLDDLLLELTRILKKEGVIKIKVPHALNVGAFADPTHKKFFTWFTFDYFGSNKQSYYSKARVKVAKKKFIVNPGRKSSIILKPIEYFVNLVPSFYMMFMSFLPANEIYFELKHFLKNE